MHHSIRLQWTAQIVLEASVAECLSDHIEFRRINLITGESNVLALYAPLTIFITGLLQASDRHVLVGARNTVICVDVDAFRETCRARGNDGGQPLEDDAAPEECLAPGGFAWDADRRRLWMLNGYFDEAALSCYSLSPTGRSFRRLSRREVCGDCPRGHSDLLTSRGICLLPKTGNVVALFCLEQLFIDIEPGQPVPAEARLCWIAEFTQRSDLWTEVVCPINRDFEGDTDVMDIGALRGIQLASAEDWYPQPVAIDSRRIAFSTSHGRVLLTDLETAKTICLLDGQCEVGNLHFRPHTRKLVLETAEGLQLTARIPPRSPWTGDHPLDSRRRIRTQPLRFRKFSPPEVPSVATQVLTWAAGKPVAITHDGLVAVAGRCVIDVSSGRTVCVLPRHPEQIRQVAITQDRQVVTCDGIVRVFDGQSGESVGVLSEARRFAVSPCEKFIAALDFRQLQVWDLRSLELVFTTSSGGNVLAWSPDGLHLAYGGWRGRTEINPSGAGLITIDDSSLTVLESLTGNEVARFEPGKVCHLVWTDEGLLAHIDEELRFLEKSSGQALRTLPVEPFDSCVLSPDRQFLATARNYGRLSEPVQHPVCHIVRLSDGLPVCQIRRSLSMTTSVSCCFTSDNRLLISSDHLQMYSIPRATRLIDFGPSPDNPGASTLAARSPKAVTQILSSMSLKTEHSPNGPIEQAEFHECIQVWDLTQSQHCDATFHVSRFGHFVPVPLLSPDGRLLAVCVSPDHIEVWSASQPVLRSRIRTGLNFPVAMAFNCDSSLIAVAASDHAVEVWRPDPPDLLWRSSPQTTSVVTLSFSEDSAGLAAGLLNGTVRVWPVTGIQTRPAQQPTVEGRLFGECTKPIRAVCLPSDGSRLLAASEDKAIRVWNTDSGDLEFLAGGPPSQICQQLLPLQGNLIAANYGTEIWIWDIAAQRPIARMRTLSQSIGGVDSHHFFSLHGVEYHQWPVGSTFSQVTSTGKPL